MASKAIPPEAKYQPDGPNELRLVTTGKRANLYVNGVAVGVITGVPMKGEWQFGLYAEGGQAQATGQFSSLIVRKPKVAGK